MKFFSKARSITLDKTKTALAEKLRESAVSVIPIIVIVALLCLCVLPMSTDLLLAFLVGAIMIVAGMGLFSLGAEQSMTPIGNKIGTALTKTKNLPLIIGVSFLLGSCRNRAEHQQNRASCHGRRRRRTFHVVLHGKNPVRFKPEMGAYRLLCCHIHTCGFFR